MAARTRTYSPARQYSVDRDAGKWEAGDGRGGGGFAAVACPVGAGGGAALPVAPDPTLETSKSGFWEQNVRELTSCASLEIKRLTRKNSLFLSCSTSP